MATGPVCGVEFDTHMWGLRPSQSSHKILKSELRFGDRIYLDRRCPTSDKQLFLIFLHYHLRHVKAVRETTVTSCLLFGI